MLADTSNFVDWRKELAKWYADRRKQLIVDSVSGSHLFKTFSEESYKTNQLQLSTLSRYKVQISYFALTPLIKILDSFNNLRYNNTKNIEIISIEDVLILTSVR